MVRYVVGTTSALPGALAGARDRGNELHAVAAVSLFGKLPSVASGEVSELAEGARLEIA